MDKQLEVIFSNINDWLKYAEAKSATLIAGNGVIIFGVSRAVISPDINNWLYMYLMVSLILSVISLSICLLSVIPTLDMPWDSIPEGKNSDDNIIYFGDIAKYTPIAYLNTLSEHLNKENHGITGYEKDLATQIITNAVIARRKYNYFKVAIWFSLSAVLSPILSILIYMFRRK